MDMNILTSKDFEKSKKEMDDTITKAAKGSDSKILKEKADEIKRECDPKIEKNCRIIHMLVDEALDEYEEGEMELGEVIEDLYKALKAIE